jgi:hypothetical protein
MCPGCGTQFVVPSPPAAAAAHDDEEEIVTPPDYAPASAPAAAASSRSKVSPAAAPVRPAAARGGTAFNPLNAAAMKAQREKDTRRFSVNWGLIAIGVVVLLLLVGVGLFLTGPKKVWNEWEGIAEDANDAVTSVVTKGLESHTSEIGAYNPRKPHGRPQATEVTFFRPTMVMSMPDIVEFRGSSTVGPFVGKYHPKSGEVEAEVAIGGGIGIPGSGGKKTSGESLHVTGRVKDHNVSAEVNGKPAVLHFPPPSEDE